MSTKFVVSWVEPIMVVEASTTRQAAFVQNTLAAAQSDLHLDEVRLIDLRDGRRRVEAEITLTQTDADLDRIREWVIEQVSKQANESPGVLMVSPPRAVLPVEAAPE